MVAVTAPTREQVEEWKRAAIAYAASLPQSFRVERDVYSERLAELAFAAGQSGQASGAGAELAPELDQIEEALTDSVRAFEASGMNPKMQNRALWSFMRLRAALISGDAAREDAERLEVELAWQRFCWKNVRMLAARHRKEEWAQHMLRFCDEAGVKASPLRDAAIDRARGGK